MTEQDPAADASEAYAAAVALGARLPAPSGTVAYLALRPRPDGTVTDILGVFSSLQEAVRAHADYARSVWNFDNNHTLRRTAPWMTDDLYEQATSWRVPEDGITEDQYSLLLSVGSQALAELRRRHAQWFEDRTDEETAIEHLRTSLDGDIDPREEDLSEAGTWYPFIQETTIDARMTHPTYADWKVQWNPPL